MNPESLPGHTRPPLFLYSLRNCIRMRKLSRHSTSFVTDHRKKYAPCPPRCGWKYFHVVLSVYESCHSALRARMRSRLPSYTFIVGTKVWPTARNASRTSFHI